MKTDNWILTYYQQIRSGDVIVGHWIEAWYELVVKGLEDKSFFYDHHAATKAIRFIEQHCRHHEGALAPNLIRLEVWQKALISVLFGIKDASGARQFREAFVVIGRKNGKTLLASAIAAYMAFLDEEYGARIFFFAPKLEQARLCFEGFHQTILNDADMNAMSKKRRTDIYIPERNTSAQPLAFSAKKSDGLNPHLAVCDEVAAWQGEPGLKQYEVIKSALGARRQPLVLSISTANFISDGIYDELVKRSTAVLNGTSRETRLAPFLYMIDDVEKWNDINELHKSMPNLGVSVSVDYMLEEIAVAEGSLSKKSEFICKYCNIKQNASTAWLTMQDVKKCFGNNYTLEDFRHSYALGGIDLSQCVDLTAATIVIERKGVSYFFTQFFMPRNKLETATAEDGIPYEAYVQRGLLTLSGDNIVDYNDVLNWFEMLRTKYEILPQVIGFDRYSSQYLVQDMQANGYIMESVIQGGNLTGILNDMEGMIKDGTLRCADDNDLMKIHMLDAALKFEANSNRKCLIKINQRAHIDGMAALSDAICMRHNHWEEMGDLLRNVR